ncbi:MAG TPA: hypothetical protein VD866_22715 [Urbifossiella sp.]|nr:hypothetical protein [Urbifossiella sp.]
MARRGLGEQSLRKLYAVKYSREGLKTAVERVFRENLLLSEVTRKVLVTTFRLDGPRSWEPLRLDNLPGPDASPAGVRVVDATLCKSAVLTHLEPYRLKGVGYLSALTQADADKAIGRFDPLGVLTEVSNLLTDSSRLSRERETFRPSHPKPHPPGLLVPPTDHAV